MIWPYKNLNQGQVVTFFALSFVVFMVFLTMILNAGFLTRDRIKIQNTVDLAALVGANVQRYNLNAIGEINDGIENAYNVLATTLANPITASPCFFTFQTCQTTAGNCNNICPNYDTIYANSLVTAYTSLQAAYAGQGLGIITQANRKAYEFAKRTALAPANLPVDIKRQILKNYGGQFPAADQTVQTYDSGGLQFDYAADGESEALQEIYRITANDQQPLFIPEITSRMVLSYRFSYFNCVQNLGTLVDGTPCASTGGGFKLPQTHMVPYRIDDTGGMTPMFVAAVSYSPQFFINKIRLRSIPDPNHPAKAGEIATGPGGVGVANLFDMLPGSIPFSTTPGARQFMSSWAASRPFGGSADRGGYDGAKLIGLASQQVGEIVQELGIRMPVATGDAMHVITERDFLH